jgi:hypothetical protein
MSQVNNFGMGDGLTAYSGRPFRCKPATVPEHSGRPLWRLKSKGVSDGLAAIIGHQTTYCSDHIERQNM